MSDMPELRDGPPWAMEEMIQAQPGLVEPILASSAALEAAESIREGGPITIVGCGTSEHAAMAGARADRRRARPRRVRGLARPAARRRPDRDLARGRHRRHARGACAPRRPTARARSSITARPETRTGADIVVGTPLVDTSWCHTVGYVSPLLALTAIAGTDRRRHGLARHRRARSPSATAFAEAARILAECRAPDRRRQRPRRDHRARDLAQDRGGRARPGHAARHREGPARPPARRRRRHRPRSSSGSTRPRPSSATSAPATCSPRPPSSRCRRS